MDRAALLQPGHEIRCPNCPQWHSVISGHTQGTPYTVQMLYFLCRGARYYAGQQGHPCRHLTRTQITRTSA